MGFVEWSGGHGESQYQEALGGPQQKVFHNRLSAGFTYTTSNKVSLTVEGEYDGAALDKTNWKALGQGLPTRYVQYRSAVQTAQDIPTKEALFAYASWQDAMFNHLDLSALVREDLIDQSRLTWGEARYHWDHLDLAVQWQHYGGKMWSDFGALPEKSMWQVVSTYYF